MLMNKHQSGGGVMPKEQPQPNRSATTDQPVWLDGQDILLRLHISVRTLQYWRSKHMIPYNKVGKKIFYKESDVNAMIENNRVLPTPKKG
jgi:hypothetical protein